MKSIKKTTKNEVIEAEVPESNTITIRYEIPDLLEAVCYHPSCPNWLKHGIWDVFSNRNSTMVYTRHHWQATFDAIKQEQNYKAEVSQ